MSLCACFHGSIRSRATASEPPLRTLSVGPLSLTLILFRPVIQMRIREQIARLVQFFRRNGLGVTVPLEHLEDAHRGQRPPASSEDRLREAPDLCLREPGEQPGSELGRQDGDPGDIPIGMKRDRQAAPLHLNVRGTEGGDLVRAPACGDQRENGSVAQSQRLRRSASGLDRRAEEVRGRVLCRNASDRLLWGHGAPPFVREHNLSRSARPPNRRLARIRRKSFILCWIGG